MYINKFKILYKKLFSNDLFIKQVIKNLFMYMYNNYNMYNNTFMYIIII